jgi:FRG domain
VPLPVEYWAAYEREVESLSEFVAVVQSLAATWPERRFVWRGVADARYALHSSLYRRALKKHGGVLREGGGTGPTLRMLEDAIFSEARAWGLQRTPTDRLTALELLAGLQHQGVPTRLLDFSHNAFVGLWFAVEEKVDIDGNPKTRPPRAVVRCPSKWARDWSGLGAPSGPTVG